MSSYLTSTQIAVFTGIFSRHFDTFSYDRQKTITIHKEPVKTINNGATNPIYGYEDSNPPSFTYTFISQSFPAVIVYDIKQHTSELEEMKNKLGAAEVQIKVEQNARDYIEDGRKNEKIEFEGRVYNTISNEEVQNFLGLKYYIYRLKNTL